MSGPRARGEAALAKLQETSEARLGKLAQQTERRRSGRRAHQVARGLAEGTGAGDRRGEETL